MARGFIAVVDYHKGNLMSVERGLAAAGAQVTVTDDPGIIRAASGVVIPGVGAFDDAMAYMVSSGQDAALAHVRAAGVPILGICLGMQLVLGRGNEHAEPPKPGELVPWTQGLAFIDGDVTRMEARGVKVPHMGWNSVEFTATGNACRLFSGVEDGSYFYFTHSYVCQPADSRVVAARTEHGRPFCSALWDGANVWGTQFHPEKSSDVGAKVLANYVDIVREA